MSAIIVVGIDGWEEFTLPALQSIRQYDNRSMVISVDAASKAAYPRTEYGITLRLDRSPSYAYAINAGIALAGKHDWYMVVNNDVLFKGPINFGELDPGLLYSRQIIEEDGHRWMGLWVAAISRDVWQTVGRFDEKFLICGFEDADYCIRAKQLGVDTVHYPFPIHHFWGKTRWGVPGYNDIRDDNINYFASKHGFRLGENMKVVND